MKRRAFTLIELLVVISIIALLVGILLPALGAARESAKLAVCASGLHQIGVGTMAYVIDHDSYLPSDEQTTANFGPYNLYSGRIWPTQVAAVTGFNGFKRFHNLGRLYDKDYIGDEDIFYCPSMETEPYTRDTYDSPWPAPKVGASSPNGRVHTSYQFNPRVAKPVTNMESHAQERRYERIDDFKTADVVVMDTVAKEGEQAHVKKKGFNISLSDGSATFENNGEAYAWFDQVGAGGGAVNSFPTYHDKFLQILLDEGDE